MVNYQELITEANYLDTKKPEDHNMAHIVCGSVSCALGDIALRRDEWVVNRHRFRYYFRLIDYTRDVLGLNERDSYFLFGLTYVPISGGTYHVREEETPTQTAARIRKFAYYRLRKAEIFAEYNEKLGHQFEAGVNLNVELNAND